MSIIDTLITDRTQADVIAGNQKGTYNASDLNRVSAAMEYLHDLFESYGYSMPNYKRIMLPRPGHYETKTVTKPVLPDGYTQLEYIESTGAQHFVVPTPTVSNGFTIEFSFCSGEQPSGYYPLFVSIINNGLWIGWYNGAFVVRKCNVGDVFTCNFTKNTWIDAKLVYSGTTVTLFFDDVQVGSGTASFADGASITYFLYDGANKASCKLGKFKFSSGTELYHYFPCQKSDGTIGFLDNVNSVFCGNYGTGSFTAGPENIEYETITEEVFVPDERDPYTWFEDDVPTSGIMAQYIANLSELRGQFAQAATTPPVPKDMEGLTRQEANNIEKILEDVDALLTNISAAWFYSGELYSGEV